MPAKSYHSKEHCNSLSHIMEVHAGTPAFSATRTLNTCIPQRQVKCQRRCVIFTLFFFFFFFFFFSFYSPDAYAVLQFGCLNCLLFGCVRACVYIYVCVCVCVCVGSRCVSHANVAVTVSLRLGHCTLSMTNDFTSVCLVNSCLNCSMEHISQNDYF